LYIVVLVGLVIIGMIKGVFADLIGSGEMASSIVAEVIGAALMFGLLVFIIQRVMAPAQSLADKLEMFGKEQDRIRSVQEKMLSGDARPRTEDRRPMAAQAAPPPVRPEPVATPIPEPPPTPKRDTLEMQLEKEIEAINFDDMFAEYNSQRDEARERGENFDDDENRGTLIQSD
jgi:hypothetical protein